MLSNKVKAWITERGIPQGSLKELLGLSTPQSVSNKINKNQWSLKDFIKIVDFLGGKVVVRFDDRDVVITKDDLK